MTKKEVQKRVLQHNKQLPLSKFNWDQKTNTFSSNERDLVLNFHNIHHCIFNTDSDCTFNTGSDCIFNTSFNCAFKTDYNCTFKTGFNCTFNTDYKCTFNTGSNCTFNTDSYCTFKTGSNSVIIRRDKFQVIQPKENEIIKLCPYGIPGYISKHDGEDSFYMETKNGREKHIIADGILSKVISKRKNVYKVINHNETKETYLIEVDGKFSHGETLKQAKESLIYKLSDRDTSKYESMTVDTELTFEEGVQMYMTITGACERGTKYFVDNVLKTKKKKYKISEIIDLTVGQYEHRKIVEFFK